MNVTLDGYMSGLSCELDWHFQNWSEDMAECLCEQLSKTDTVLLGRVTYKAMAKYWQTNLLDLSYAREDIAFAEMMNSHKKVVFSNTLSSPDWRNSRLIKGDFGKEIMKLKRLAGKDIIVYGSGVLVSSLLQLELIDEYILWVHPVILGKGKPLFDGLQNRLLLTLQRTQTFSSGVIAIYYKAANNSHKNFK